MYRTSLGIFCKMDNKMFFTITVETYRSMCRMFMELAVFFLNSV